MSSPYSGTPQDLANTSLRDAKVYHLYLAAHEDFGITTGGSSTTLADNSKNWGVNTWTNFMVINISTGEERIITSNTAHVLTVTVAWDRQPVAGHLYKICGPNWSFESAAQPNLRATVYQAGTQAVVGAGGDGTATQAGLFTHSQTLLRNNAGTQDFARANISLYNVSDTTTTTFTGADIATFNAKALLIVIDCTSLTGTSYVPEVQWKDASGAYPSLWKQLTAKTGIARTIIALGPGCAGAVVDPGTTTSDAGLGTTDSATAAQLVQIPFAVPPIIRIKITKTAVTVFTANLQVEGS